MGEPADGGVAAQERRCTKQNKWTGWRCKQKAMNSHSLCEHHFLKLQDRQEQLKKSILIQKQRCTKQNKWTGWRCKQQAMISHSLCEHHFLKLQDQQKQLKNSILIQKQRCTRQNKSIGGRCKQKPMVSQSLCEHNFLKLQNQQEQLKESMPISPVNQKMVSVSGGVEIRKRGRPFVFKNGEKGVIVSAVGSEAIRKKGRQLGSKNKKKSGVVVSHLASEEIVKVGEKRKRGRPSCLNADNGLVVAAKKRKTGRTVGSDDKIADNGLAETGQKRKTGRPVGSKDKSADKVLVEVGQKRKRGRPVGSKDKSIDNGNVQVGRKKSVGKQVGLKDRSNDNGNVKMVEKRKRGRPVGSKDKSDDNGNVEVGEKRKRGSKDKEIMKTSLKGQVGLVMEGNVFVSGDSVPVPKKTGRPKGSKNKKKIDVDKNENNDGKGDGVNSDSYVGRNLKTSKGKQNGINLVVKKLDGGGCPKSSKNTRRSVVTVKDYLLPYEDTSTVDPSQNNVLMLKDSGRTSKVSGIMKKAVVRGNKSLNQQGKRGRPKGSKNKRNHDVMEDFNSTVGCGKGVHEVSFGSGCRDGVLKRNNGRGRPKGSKNKIKTSVGPLEIVEHKDEKKKKRGRPKGSKNKRKNGEVQSEITGILSIAYPRKIVDEAPQRKDSCGRPEGSKNKKKNVCSVESGNHFSEANSLHDNLTNNLHMVEDRCKRASRSENEKQLSLCLREVTVQKNIGRFGNRRNKQKGAPGRTQGSNKKAMSENIE